MKRIFLIIISAALLMSCKDLLNMYPANQIATASMWTTEALADAGIAGLYKNFYVANNTSSNSRLDYSEFIGINRITWMAMEYQSNYYANTGSYMLTDPVKRPDRNAGVYDWKWCYTGIHRINDAIQNLENAPLSTEKYERYLCEAKFLRAWYYARLNMIYQGVPVYLEPISNEECTRAQSTSAEVWQVVIDDLNDCINNEYVQDNTLTTNYGRPSKGAAYALRGMAYMWLAWENGEDNAYYQLAADDFEMVAQCGYGLWAGNPMDFFTYENNNDHDHEMIFPIQFVEDDGLADYRESLFGTRDTYNSWSDVRPSYDFVNYFQNADGSKFEWTSRIPEWDDDVFLEDPVRREVFFLRDSVTLGDDDKVVQDYWNSSQAGAIEERIKKFGVDVFRKYYLKDGNEDRIRSVYNNRDTRLKDIVLTPYDPYDCYFTERNNDETAIGKELRWPYCKDEGIGGHDIYVGCSVYSQYIYKKFVHNRKGQLAQRIHDPSDWPLIRYTDVYLYLAECYVHLGRLAEAVAIVNEIRQRVGMPDVSLGSSDEVMEAVRYERRVELCAEGIDWFDEWRWGTYKEMKFAGNDTYGDTSWWGEWNGYLHVWYYTDNMYPFGAPLEECVKNTNLTRREGWAY